MMPSPGYSAAYDAIIAARYDTMLGAQGPKFWQNRGVSWSGLPRRELSYLQYWPISAPRLPRYFKASWQHATACSTLVGFLGVAYYIQVSRSQSYCSSVLDPSATGSAWDAEHLSSDKIHR